ncbi:MAG: hypothetical protein Q7U20_09525 [Caulobacter sp.]|nr:hypothetical protein [Caulobacter sp.]
MKAHPTSTYVTASRRTWEMIRAAYLSGLSAPTVAARFGVSVSGLRKRAQREGWTKRNQADWRSGVQVGPPSPGPWPAPGPDAAQAAAPVPPSAPIPDTGDLPPELAGLHAIAVPPAPLDAPSVARKALSLAMRALTNGRSADALRLARAAALIAKLDEVVPQHWEVDNPDEVESRHTALQDLAFNIAGELAEALMAGKGEVLPVYLERARQWRRNLGLAEDYVSPFEPREARTEATEDGR